MKHIELRQNYFKGEVPQWYTDKLNAMRSTPSVPKLQTNYDMLFLMVLLVGTIIAVGMVFADMPSQDFVS